MESTSDGVRKWDRWSPEDVKKLKDLHRTYGDGYPAQIKFAESMAGTDEFKGRTAKGVLHALRRHVLPLGKKRKKKKMTFPLASTVTPSPNSVGALRKTLGEWKENVRCLEKSIELMTGK